MTLFSFLDFNPVYLTFFLKRSVTSSVICHDSQITQAPFGLICLVQCVTPVFTPTLMEKIIR